MATDADTNNSGSNGENAVTMEQLATALQELKSENAALKGQLDGLGLVQGKEGLRVPPPVPFTGKNKELLQTFLTQCRVYHQAYAGALPLWKDRVLNAGAFLREDAAIWFEPFQREQTDPSIRTKSAATSAVFRSWDGFEEAIKGAFGLVNEVKIWEKKLTSLKMEQGKASEHYSKFQQWASKLTTWNEGPLFSVYHSQLTGEVKDALALQTEKPDNLIEYAKLVIEIDTNLTERRQEKKTEGKKPSYFTPKQYQPNTRRTRHWHNRPNSTAYTNAPPGPMELDNMQGKCFNCGKVGHYANKCRSPKKAFQPVKEGKKKELNTMNQVTLAVMTSEEDMLSEDSRNDSLPGGQWEMKPRYYPAPEGEDTEILIYAVTQEHAEEDMGLRTMVMELDDPRLKQDHEDHPWISWASCFHHNCMRHMGQKLGHGVFPVRTPAPVTQVYSWSDLAMFTMTNHNQERSIAKLSMGSKYPISCLTEEETWQTCPYPECVLHMADKISHWYQLVGDKPILCAGSNYDCRWPNCVEHLAYKAYQASMDKTRGIPGRKIRRYEHRWGTCPDAKNYAINCSMTTCRKHRGGKRRDKDLMELALQQGLIMDKYSATFAQGPLSRRMNTYTRDEYETLRARRNDLHDTLVENHKVHCDKQTDKYGICPQGKRYAVNCINDQCDDHECEKHEIRKVMELMGRRGHFRGGPDLHDELYQEYRRIKREETYPADQEPEVTFNEHYAIEELETESETDTSEDSDNSPKN